MTTSMRAAAAAGDDHRHVMVMRGIDYLVLNSTTTITTTIGNASAATTTGLLSGDEAYAAAAAAAANNLHHVKFAPNLFEWCLMFFALNIFLVGILGNLLVILVVVKNAHMRTITNIFIVNLAIGDFLVILICLPPTLITDVTGSWWFGETMCKVMPYVQVRARG
jgi:hypothetical protein